VAQSRAYALHVAWIASLALIVTVLGVGIPVRYAYHRAPCDSEPRCFDVDQLPPSGIRTLASNGMSLDAYAAYMTAIAGVVTLFPLVQDQGTSSGALRYGS
jgi:hypothetical protein